MTLDLADRMALADLVHRYAAEVDDRRFDRVVELFLADATLSLPDPPRSLEPIAVHRGHAEIRRAISTVTAAARTQHAIVGEVYTQQTGAVSGRIACIAHHWSGGDDQLTDIAWHVRYDDEYVHTDAGWRFRSRALTIDAIEARPARRLRPEAT